MASKCLCGWGWPWTTTEPSASTFQVLGFMHVPPYLALRHNSQVILLKTSHISSLLQKSSKFISLASRAFCDMTPDNSSAALLSVMFQGSKTVSSAVLSFPSSAYTHPNVEGQTFLPSHLLTVPCSNPFHPAVFISKLCLLEEQMHSPSLLWWLLIWNMPGIEAVWTCALPVTSW